MASQVWLDRDEDFRPGAELLRSDRLFALWSYSATHGQLLLRADHMPDGGGRLPTTTEVLFNPVDAVQIQAAYRGLVIRCATEDEAMRVDGDLSDDGYRSENARVLVLESEGATGYVVAVNVGWCEGKLSDLQPSFFNTFSPYDPMWPVRPLTGVGGELEIASPQEVAEAFLTGPREGVRRERHRYMHLLTALTEQDGRRRWHNLGVFLTEKDAEEAKRLIEPHVTICDIEMIPVVL
ncbi:hypothetical protein AB0F68_07170 [Micromonospora sp. NPDC023966]|uniref:hypothetical protein n=1 Tax=Micromonospora sp. NPDC023966 TaxID=3154699 RepID=UPI0033F62DB1